MSYVRVTSHRRAAYGSGAPASVDWGRVEGAGGISDFLAFLPLDVLVVPLVDQHGWSIPETLDGPERS
ncbi:rCG43914 [Rattus norvegicus]|uniref:RCG43914 n=1 Tax=Rattus norvegicus TaxID=10116 RepID=A6J7C0_RAT|nr:rCG43914 [Rattus norvegicus]